MLKLNIFLKEKKIHFHSEEMNRKVFSVSCVSIENSILTEKIFISSLIFRILVGSKLVEKVDDLSMNLIG